ncbi:type II toxin-antitoxin system VapC family toxin [Ruania alkalisoli]|uniref:Type II toxin-antitoxin system VapC family toxin n=1 Tax=Ruania alkalisoli TaxID=2779775 RepID=A0A7M1SPL3_9MICO|nr:type II toxin-antitoxin system VapC family toxin [Ruania alkalisoli]QOR69490.1 type II toxin-antitoxin system VapC family toxin [Ruania alkalisoli]
MRRILADTHVLLWWLADDPSLRPHHRDLLADPDVAVWFSAVSITEIAIKQSLGTLSAPEGAAETLIEEGFSALPLAPEHAAALATLPWHHRDPFDRMLIAQAQVESMTIATVDRRFAGYEVLLA